MTTAIIAKNYDEAQQAATELCVGHDWVYPHDEATAAARFDKLVLVTGYTEGEIANNQALMQQVHANLKHDAPAVYHDLDADGFDALMAPFLDPDGLDPIENYTPRHASRSNATAIGLTLAALTGAAIGIAGIILAVTVGWLPWG